MKNVMAINERDAKLLTEFIKQYQIQSILEFGTGESTLLFESLGVEVISFDTNPEYLEKYKSKLKTSPFLWGGRVSKILQQHCRNIKIDMVFIDGPEGGENREPSYQLALETSAKFIACHDANRQWESRWITKYLREWSLVKSNATLTIFENKPCTSRVLIGMPMPRDYRVDFEAMRFCTTSMRNGWHWLNCPSVEPTLARNMIITWFLLKEEFADYTHLFFLDADTIPPPNTIEKLLSHDKDVIAGITPIWLKGTVYWNVQIDGKRNLHSSELPEKLSKVIRVGGTTILIKRQVLEKLKFPYCKIIIPETKEQVLKDGPMAQGGDYYLCDRIHDAGFDIYVDPDIRCKHIRPVNLLDLVSA